MQKPQMWRETRADYCYVGSVEEREALLALERRVEK